MPRTTLVTTATVLLTLSLCPAIRFFQLWTVLNSVAETCGRSATCQLTGAA